ncbi:STAS domain-containing protein [Streptacidiphilus cavernicola]|uniref:STAS domain-containing protein n=1 Tax=Streptacidiphilus cavernicola TaxID=3342716 RepID=A0ABV6VPP7_9ACTN
MGDGPSTTLLVWDGQGTAEIMLVGGVDRATDHALDDALAQLLVDPRIRHIDIDVALVESCDFGGLTTLLRAHHLAANFGVPLQLAQAGPGLRRTLSAMGLSELLLKSP